MAELKHHGIKGQKWGVRHGPPYPLDSDESIRIKKGSSVSHITTEKKIKLDKRGIYGFDPHNEVDADIYRGPYAAFLSMSRYTGALYEQEFITTEDLLLPNQKEKVRAFEELYKEDKNFKEVIDEIKKINNTYDKALKDTEKLRNLYAKGKISQEEFLKRCRSIDEILYDDSEIGYRMFIREKITDWYKECGIKRDTTYGQFMANFEQLKNDPKQVQADKAFVDKLRSMGYNAMIDDNNAGVYNKAEAPLYIFSGADSLEQVRSKGRRLKNDGATYRVEKRNNGQIQYSEDKGIIL